MAVHTKLTFEEINDHLKNYDLGNLVEFKEILDGIDNSNFIIFTESGKYILTIFEERINKSYLSFFIDFVAHLANQGVSCPHPITDNRGQMLTDLKSKKSVIVTFLNGSHPQEIESAHCFEVGKALASLHLAAASFKPTKPNDLGILGWKSFFAKFSAQTQKFQAGLDQEITAAIEFLTANWRFDLPNSVCHLDFFPDNVFFDENQKISGLIDFYFAATDSWIYDFAVTINAWCFDGVEFNPEKFNELFRGYQSLRKFSETELDFLSIACIGASMRFLLTRLFNKFNTKDTSLAKIKDPLEYLAKLRFFRSYPKLFIA